MQMQKFTFSSHSIKFGLILVMFIGIHLETLAQDPLRYQKEVEQITETYAKTPRTDDLIIFTGSSSIKMWKNINEYFPEHEIMNNGFGGSQTVDLLQYADELIINYRPKKVFIYEGDNDISAKKSSTEIILTMHKLVEKIHQSLPDTEILLISAKPSVSRWQLKDQYLDLNQHFEEYSQLFDYVSYVDIWTTMLNDQGSPKTDIFLEDNLHMNKGGYDLWAEVVEKYLD